MRVLIDYVAEGKSADARFVFVRPINFVHFRLTPDTTLDQCPVESLGFPPRMKKGEHIITFILKHESDLQRLSAGHEALVDAIEPIKPMLPK